MGAEGLRLLLFDYGLWILGPLAVLEGPATSVLAGYLLRIGVLSLPPVFVMLVLADLLGDCALYLVGRRGGVRQVLGWLKPFGLTPRHVARGLRAFRKQGGRMLVMGKLTHSAGFAVLMAAGMARMPFGRFLALNLLATLPKTAAFLVAGWGLGEAALRFGPYVWGLALIVAAVLVTAFLMPSLRRKGCPP